MVWQNISKMRGFNEVRIAIICLRRGTFGLTQNNLQVYLWHGWKKKRREIAITNQEQKKKIHLGHARHSGSCRVVWCLSLHAFIRHSKQMSALVFSTDDVFFRGELRHLGTQQDFHRGIYFGRIPQLKVQTINRISTISSILFTPENVIFKFAAKVIFLLCISFNHFEYPRQSPYLHACIGYPSSERLNCMWAIRNVCKV